MTTTGTTDPREAMAGGLSGHDGTTALWDELAGLGRADLVRRYRASVACFDDRVFELTDAQLDQAWAPEAGVGVWPIRVLLGHLADAELVWAQRIRRAAAEPGSVLSVWDEHAWIDAGMYGADPSGATSPNGVAAPVGAFVAAVYTLRQWVGEWLSGLNDDVWSRRVMHPERGPLGMAGLVTLNTWHVEHHGWYLNAKIVKLLGEREACEPAGCANPACACGASSSGGTPEPRGDAG